MNKLLNIDSFPLLLSTQESAVTPLWAQRDADFFVWATRQQSDAVAYTSPIESVPILSGPRDDVLDGSPLADVLRGFGGNDTINDGAGNDRVYGGSGDDLLDDGYGNDLLKGGAGNDLIRGLAGQNTLDGGDGNDVLFAGGSGNLMYGGIGNDLLVADRETTIYGGQGDDRVLGDYGHSNIYLGDGNDYFKPYLAATPSSAVAGGLGTDTLDLTDRSDWGVIGVFSNEIAISRSAGNVTLTWTGLGFGGTVTLRSFETIILANGTFDLADFL